MNISKEIKEFINSGFGEIHGLLLRLTDSLSKHTADKSNPHSITKSQIGLGNIPNKVTDNRFTSESSLLLAKAMYDHTKAGDHDARYLLRDEFNQKIKELDNNTQQEILDDIATLKSVIQSDGIDLSTLTKALELLENYTDAIEGLSAENILGLSEFIVETVAKLGNAEPEQINLLRQEIAEAKQGELYLREAEEGLRLITGQGFEVTIPSNQGGHAGLLSVSDKLKLDDVEKGAQVNPQTTSVRNLKDRTKVLEAKALADHNESFDHDGRYYPREELNVVLEDIRGQLSFKIKHEALFTEQEKRKLESISENAQRNIPTNLTVTVNGNVVAVCTSTGLDARLPLATDKAAGLLSVEDKLKLDSISPEAQRNVGTDLHLTTMIDSVRITSSTGEGVLFPAATVSQAGVMTPTLLKKVMGISPGAEVNTPIDLVFEHENQNCYLKTNTSTQRTMIPMATETTSGLMATQDKRNIKGLQDEVCELTEQLRLLRSEMEQLRNKLGPVPANE